jgi:signal transduction histidine kinase
VVNGATRPPRGARLRRRFWTALDYLTAVFFAVLIFAVLAFHSSGPREVMSPRYVLLALLALGLSVPVAIRRRVPVRSLLIVLAGCLIILIIGGSITQGPFLPLAVVLYLVASTCRRSVALAGLAGALGLLIAQGVVLHFEGVGSGNATAAGLVLTIFWMVGYLVQQRRTYVAHLRERAATDAVTRERLRIARELHDVVAHSMTVVTVQAGFGEYVFDSQPAEARAALSAIQAVSREALGEMQRMLCVLRQTDGDIAAADAELAAREPAVTGLPVAGTAAAQAPDGTGPDGTRPGGAGPGGTGPGGTGPAADEALAPEDRLRAARFRPTAPLAPAPGLANLGRLVERTAGAGVTVTVERIGEPCSLPASLDLSAYRIVQESLTNVVKHSGAGRCHVVLEYGLDSLVVEITDPGAGAPSEAAPAARAAVAVRGNVPAVAGVPIGARVPAGAGAPAGPARTGPTAPPARTAAPARPPVRLGGGAERAGHGIIGMRERASLCGGDLHALPRPGGGFVVRARLPLRSEQP